MQILADENIPRIIVSALRQHGHDVLWVMEAAPGSPDRSVLQLASDQHRLLLTFDLDFGELIFRMKQLFPYGIILLRIPILPPEQLARFVLQTLESRDDWANHFSVLDGQSLRMISLPGEAL